VEIHLQTEEGVTTVPLNEITPPDATHNAFLEGLGQQISADQPHWCAPIYALSNYELANTTGDPSPKPVGWYCAAMTAEGFMAGEVPTTPDGPNDNSPLTTSLTFGSLVDLTWNAFMQLKQHPELQAQSFDVRWLRIAGLGIDAFWLKSTAHGEYLGGDDRIFAFLAFQPELENQLLTAADFLKIVRTLAAASLLIDTSPKIRR
jgi:hypothetical protein